MVWTSILYGAQDASMTIFVARALAIITSNLPIPKNVVGNPVWIQEFQQDILKRTQRPILSCPEVTLACGLEITKEERTEIRKAIWPIWRKYLDACNEYVKLHKGTSNEVDLFRARTLIDIFSVAWTEIASLFDQISRMILAKKSAKPELDVSCIDWAFKRISLAQFAVFNLLQGNAYNYFSLFKTKIAPYLHQALLQKEENEEAEKFKREAKQLANFPTSQETASEALRRERKWMI